MPVTDSYADAATYRAVIDKSDTGEDAEILLDLTAVSRFMEKSLGRHFTRDAAGVARDFYAPSSGPIYPDAENPWKYARGSRDLYIDDLSAAPSSVLVDENGDGTPETAYTTYELLPLNAAAGPEPAPYTHMRIPVWANRLAWPNGRLVRITGQWGWPAVPEAIRRACIHLTAILRLETPRSQATVSEIGQLVQMSPEAAGIVYNLQRHYGKVAL